MSSDELPRPVLLTDELRAQLNSVSTATLTNQLQRKGIRSTFLTGLKPIKPGQRMLGYAHTLRFVPIREDLNAQFTAGLNAQRRAVESMAPEEVLVIEARGAPDAGTFGDVFALRALRRGAAGMITDGAVRDTPAVAELDIAVYHGASHAATFSRTHMPLEHQVPIACAGVTVMPGDIVVGDGEGAVVIPPSLVVELAAASVQQEAEESWALERVDAGESTTGVFPISKDRRPEFEAWYAARQAQDSDA
ncbi:MAG: 5-oxopent-3-ene,2,5-tricarboxylate decarboxylase / 2-hydroxyhepta-2,4-diene,7-dioate isomerase [Ilumatobacteraceae bacterium]|jgi:regulator of RNase E activity RraA